MTASTARMSAATGASKAEAEDSDKMITVTQNERLYAMAVSRWPGWHLLRAVARRALRRRTRGQDGPAGAYNAAMNKPAAPDGHGRRPSRRLAWWVAFAALAGFLLAEAT
ncbi:MULTISPECIES: hypothetical protein [Cupriavidus]|uniref:hypothetical protein n=1 Tax=Cupriavidus TaxID=106589 RepID=UPI0012E96508|nr:MULTISPECIES: hypothetical protein [Cupriavidus]MCD9123618.1 hypothetical protein [Cupriavidus sp. UGS-1]